MKILPLRHGGLPDENRTFGPVKAGKRPMHRQQPSPLFLAGLRELSAVELDPGELPPAEWALIVHPPAHQNPRSTITAVRVPLLLEIGPAGARYREALAPGERTHLAGGPRVRLNTARISAGEAFASGYYHGFGGVVVVLDELYQYDDVELDDMPFAERYRVLRELIAELSEHNPDPLTLKVTAAELHSGPTLAALLASTPQPGELRYLVRLDGMLNDPRSRLLIIDPVLATAA